MTATKAPEINILMLGETGVGKSTFINGFANYLTYQTLEEAELNDLVSLIPVRFNVTNDDYEVQKVTFGQDENEDVADGQSATQTCRCYVFPFGEYLIRIIDTPGIGDVRGIGQDKKNMENLMSFLGQYTDLHAICILMKPNNARLTVEFQFCLKQLLCQLSKSASQNIIFVFTNARSTFYKPGETLPLLKKNLEDVAKTSHVNIPINKNTVFCMDNEAFRFLVAMRNGIKFTADQKRDFAASWGHSFGESMRLVSRVIGDQHQPGLTPHKVKDTLSVNEARQAIINLSQPLAEISDNIQDNLKVLEQRKQEVKDNSGNIAVLKNKLYVPELDLKVKKLDHPATICTHSDCAKSFQVAGITKRHYKQRCHPHCHLDNVPKEILGDPSLKDCWAMQPSGENCSQCEHSYRQHMHVYYEIEVFEKKREDKNIKRQIYDKESVKRAAEQTILQVEQKKRTYEREQNIITSAMARFGCFLKTNAIAPYNDSFKDYLEHLIENEKSLSGKGMNNKEKVEGLERMLKQYNAEVQVLDQAINMPNASSHIEPDEVFKIIEQLFDLELTGKTIMQLYKTLKEGRKQENYTHRQVFYKPKGVINKVTGKITNTVRGVTNFLTGNTNPSHQLNEQNNHQQNLMEPMQIDSEDADKKLEEMIRKKLDERSKAFRFQEQSSFDDNPLPKRRNEDYQSANVNRSPQTLPERASLRLNLRREERLFGDDEMDEYRQQRAASSRRQPNINWRDNPDDDPLSGQSFGRRVNPEDERYTKPVRHQFGNDDRRDYPTPTDPVQGVDRQTGYPYPYAPPMHSLGQPMGPFQQNPYGPFWNSQMPPFAGMSPQQYQQLFQMQAQGMPFRQDWNPLSPPPSYKDVKKVDEKGDVSESKSKGKQKPEKDDKASENKSGKEEDVGKCKSSESGAKENEEKEEKDDAGEDVVDGLKKKVEETEKRMANIESLLEKLVLNSTNK